MCEVLFADLCLSHHIWVGAHFPVPELAALLPYVLHPHTSSNSITSDSAGRLMAHSGTNGSAGGSKGGRREKVKRI